MQKTSIHAAVERARAGENPFVIARMESGWLVACDKPFIKGHCVLLSDPVVFGLNDLSEPQRMIYARDCARIGDALISVLGSYRINYETLCNVSQALHSHIIPRFMSEPEVLRFERPVLAYPADRIERFDPDQDRDFMQKMREAIATLDHM